MCNKKRPADPRHTSRSSPMRRWTVGNTKAAALVLGLFGTLGCLPPSIVGFPHPDPAPLGGTESTFILFTGSGYPEMFDGGGGLSFAGRSGSTGWSVTGWGGGGLGPAGFFGLHGEAAIDLDPPPPKALANPELLHGSRLHVTLGAGLALGYGEHEPLCFTCDTAPQTREELLLGPELTAGLAGSPSHGLTGGFWGVRLGVGGSFGLLDCAGDRAVALHLGAGGGWRWRTAEGAYVDLQVVPFGGLELGNDTLSGYAGAEILLGFSFGTGARSVKPAQRSPDDSPIL
jgi:hypothetical protein